MADEHDAPRGAAVIGEAALACAIVGALTLTATWSGTLGIVRRSRAHGWLGIGLAALTAVGGIAGSIYALRAAYAATAQADPSRKATMLAEGISAALLPAEIGWIGAFVVLAIALIGLWRTRATEGV